MSRSRLVPLALAVTLLLAVVALAARGRPLGSNGGGGGGGLPPSFWDYTYTTIVLVGGIILVFLIVGTFVYRPDWQKRNMFERIMLRWLAAYVLFAMIGILIGRHHLHFGLKLPTAPPAQPGGNSPVGRAGQTAGGHSPKLAWGEVVVLLSLLLAVAAVYGGLRTRRPPRRRPESAPEVLAAALDESLDDLRTDPDLRRAIIAAYARMEAALAAAGIPRHPAEAPLEYVERALLSLDTSAGAVRRLTDLFEWARFSHHEPEPSMRDDAVDALVAVRDELRASELIPA